MSKTVTFIDDVFPYCVGDVIVLNDQELKAVDKIAKARKRKVYTDGARGEVASTTEADKNAASSKAADEAASDEGEAQVELEEAAAEKAEEEAGNNPTGKPVPGSAAGKSVKTAAKK